MRYFKRLLLGETLENVMSHETSRNVFVCKLMFGYIILVTLERIMFSFGNFLLILKKKEGLILFNESCCVDFSKVLE